MTAGPINRQARGLLSLFDISTNGRYPSGLSEVVQPVIDLRQLQLELGASPELVSNTYAALGVNTAAAFLPPASGLVVPSSEAWMVLRCSLRVLFQAAAASTIISAVPFVQLPAAASANVVFPPVTFSASTYPFTNNAAISSETQVLCEGPFVMPPGAGLGVLHGGFVFGAAQCTLVLNAQFVRIRL